MMGFADDLKRFTMKVETRSQEVFVETVTEVERSIRFGSEITGAPGQPVGQYGPGYHPGEVGGTLRASWQAVFESRTRALVGTNLVYAKPIEDGIGRFGPLKLRSTVGGFGSVKLTRAGWWRIVAFATKRVRGGET